MIGRTAVPAGAMRATAWSGFALCFAAIWFATSSLEPPARSALLISGAAILAWSFAVIDEWQTGCAASGALWVTGAIATPQIVSAVTHELIVLLIAAYVIGFAVARTGLMDAIAARLLQGSMTVATLFRRVAIVVAATAFFIPATSARAAILLPIHRLLEASLPDAKTHRALAILIPTIILLSAGAVLTGAAAHLVAVELLSAAGGRQLGYWPWLIAASPVALLSCFAAVHLGLWLFVDHDRQQQRVAAKSMVSRPLDGIDYAMMATITATIAGWITNSWHGVGLATVGTASAVIMSALAQCRAPASGGSYIRAIDWKILALLISTVLIAEALLSSGAVALLAKAFLHMVPPFILRSDALTVGMTAVIAMLAHLVIPSRSARAAVLIPALALPIANAGHDVTTLTMVIVLGTGFCQLVPYGAKPLLIFAGQSGGREFKYDLIRLGLPLMAIYWIGLVGSALMFWPVLDFFDQTRGNAN
jgi:sodium-dependent dicarboxylate transporter 2/3/5